MNFQCNAVIKDGKYNIFASSNSILEARYILLTFEHKLESLNTNLGKMRLFKIVILPSKIRPLDFQRYKMVCNLGQYPSKFNRKSSYLLPLGL